jgi:hypothetical protein
MAYLDAYMRLGRVVMERLGAFVVRGAKSLDYLGDGS